MEARPTVTNLSHYRILSKLGAGGMGEVYLAEDTRLNRKVALKVLPPAFTQDEERVRRFMLEARAASALNHPNIVAVYDLGETEAGHFIVMELVEGKTLRSLTTSDNPLETILKLGVQMAMALAAAHAAGIIHRDIKPDNIMVRNDGYIKVVDFGLARLSGGALGNEATQDHQTQPGLVIGTMQYMSPEQARGGVLGPPSDIFALGIIFYQLAAGVHPFKSESAVGYLHGITLETPQRLTRIKPEIPAALDALVLRMLEKDGAKRPTAVQVAEAIRNMERQGATADTAVTMRIEAAEISASVPVQTDEGFWVAVTPFKFRGTSASELEALAQGLTEEILTSLSHFSYLRVMSQGSGNQHSGARYLIEGSLRQAGPQLRATVQLIDTTTGEHVWAETYSRDFRPDDIFALQDDLVPRIVSTIADAYGVLPRTMSEGLRQRPAGELSAYEALLRSFGYNERLTPEDHLEVRTSLEQAVRKSPSHADCWAMLSIIYADEYKFGFNAQPDPLARALQAARRAVEAAPTNPFAHEALAQALFFRREFQAFRNAAERVIALNRSNGATVALMGMLLAFSGDWDKGCALVEGAMQLNPHHPGWYLFSVWLNAYRQNDFHRALDIALKVNMPQHFYTHSALAATYGQLGERKHAKEALRELLALKPNFAAEARDEHGKWYGRGEVLEQVVDGLRKAGLQIGSR